MTSPQPVMSRVAWLVLGVSALVFAGIILVAQNRDHSHVDTSKHVAASATKNDVELKSVLSIRQRGDVLEVVATISIENKTDQPVMYVGVPCYAPAQAAYESTLLPPSGPPYPPAAAALRAHVMDHLRSLDQISWFQPNTSRPPAMEPCDDAAPPTLPPRKTIVYVESEFLGTYAEPLIDAATTDVVTTLKLGSLPKTWTGRFPPPIQVVDTIQVRTPLSTVSDISRQSDAGYGEAARHFDLLMRDPRIAAWVDAQDPSLWREARMTSDYYSLTGTWSLEAFHHGWALPLVIKGTATALTMVQIPDEPWQPAPSTDAVLPLDTSSAERTWLPNRDMYVGDLVLPTGKVMVGDGVASDNEVLFDYGLAPGRYPIHIVTAMPLYRTADWDSVAWEELLLSGSPATHWEPAVPVGHSIKELKDGELFSFGTDGGGGGFASPEAMKYMDAALLTNADDPLLTPLSEREEANDWLWAMTTVDPKTGANVFVTSTGADGGFPILLGLDAQNRPAVLLADFGVLQMSYGGIKV